MCHCNPNIRTPCCGVECCKDLIYCAFHSKLKDTPKVHFSADEIIDSIYTLNNRITSLEKKNRELSNFIIKLVQHVNENTLDYIEVPKEFTNEENTTLA